MTYGKNKTNFSIGTADGFITYITLNIPEEIFQLVHDYAWYSNRIR